MGRSTWKHPAQRHPVTASYRVQRTTHGLDWITLGFRPGRNDVLVVAGDTAEDFALALCWDRLYGRGVWLPSSWWPTGTAPAAELARAALDHLIWRASTRAARVRVVSVSAKDALPELVAALRTPIEVLTDSNTTHLPSRADTVVQDEVDWAANGARHGSCSASPAAGRHPNSSN